MGVLSGLLEGIIPDRTPAKAAFGRGVDQLTYGIPLSSMQDDPTSRAATALAAYRWSPDIRKAERAIKNRLSTIEWWLEDSDGERITDESPEQLRAIRDGIEMPYRPALDEPETASPKTRAGLWDITIRHMGCAGPAFWFLDGIDGLAGTPLQTLYISPARMAPYTNEQGQLVGWVLDPRSRYPVKLEKKEVILFNLETPDDGFLSTGLVHTALIKAELARSADRHASGVIYSGGRRPGIYHPPSGSSIPDDVYENLKRDLRNIVEVPDSVKRSMILKGPVEFTPTDSTMSEMGLSDIMKMATEDILTLWGVPKSQTGYQRESSIGGSADDLDAEMMWRNAAGPRMATFAEVFQTQYLDRYKRLGIDLTFKYEEPEFDDEAPKYEMAQRASVVPMRAVERRAILGLEPFGDPLLDDAVHMPINIVEVATAPPLDPGDMAGKADVQEALDEAFAKARLPADVARLKEALAKFLDDQAQRIGRKIERNSAHLARRPTDTDAWWNKKEEDAALMRVLRPFLVQEALDTGEHELQRLGD